MNIDTHNCANKRELSDAEDDSSLRGVPSYFSDNIQNCCTSNEQ